MKTQTHLLFALHTLYLWTAVARGQVSPNQLATYEYVIIGSGPGGGPLAANLARAGHTVLLLEAGEDHGDSRLQRVPALNIDAAEDPTMSWEFFVNHYQDPARAQLDTKYTWRQSNGSLYVGLEPPEGAEPLGIYYPRVGTLGGCSNHNAMNFALPPDSTWDDIGNLTGDSSWTAANMRKYYEKIERCSYVPKGTAGHGFSGWLGSNQNIIDLLDEGTLQVARAAVELTSNTTVTSDDEVKQRLLVDMNRLDSKRYEQEGPYMVPLHADGMRRRSSAQTYLTETINERNADGSPKFPLTISTSSLATKVLFNTTGSKPVAVGVEYLRGSALYKADRRFDDTQVGAVMAAYASKEVVVAGGAFNTPQILKLSGIGPREELEKFNISVVVDLPAVGTNLQDNYEMGIEAVASTDFVNTYANCTGLAPGDPCLREWTENGTGPYSQGAAPVGLLLRSSVSENADTDLFLFGGAGSIFRGYFPGFSRLTVPLPTFWWSVVKMQMQNRAGTVTLRTADPQDVPEINFNYFQEGADHDMQALMDGLDRAQQIFNATNAPFAPFTNTAPVGNTSAAIQQNIQTEAWGHHASCSCPMGPANSTTACVDSNFRVLGVDNLRVVDASIFPRVPGAFPVLPTFLISEKATDAILSGL